MLIDILLIAFIILTHIPVLLVLNKSAEDGVNPETQLE